ncbi:hypothetical protein NFI96_007368, partial [Prochilodus magdalenae]
SPTALQELQVAKMLLEAEKEKVKNLQETIKHLQADKEFLKDQLSRMTGKKAIGSEVEESSGEIAGLKSKTVRGVILRYKRALQAFNQGGSMKRAFQKVGVDRNTISRTSPIAELALEAPGVFHPHGMLKEKIMQMKACGELLPMTH